MQKVLPQRVLEATDGKHRWPMFWIPHCLLPSSDTLLFHTLFVSREFKPSSEETFKLLLSSKAVHAVWPCGLSSVLPKSKASSLLDVTMALVNRSLVTGAIPASGKSATAVSIPMHTISDILSKQFHRIARSSSALKLAGLTILGRLSSSLFIPNDPLQLIYRWDRYSLDSVASFCHIDCKGLNFSAESVCSIFCDSYSSFYLISPLLLKPEYFYAILLYFCDWKNDFSAKLSKMN